MALKLVPAHRNRPTGEWDADDYDVVHEATGQTVGRIMKTYATQTSAEPWFWGIAFLYKCGSDPYYGRAETREAAAAAFRVCWDKIPDRI
jgi:hypothetical protein